MTTVGVAERRRRTETAAKWPERKKALEAAGVRVTTLEARMGHQRLTFPNGHIVDFWITTESWAVHYGTKMRGKSFDVLMATIPAQPELPPAAADVHSPAEARAGGIDCTIFADASWHHQSKAAGWGCWMKSTEIGQSLEHGGPIAAALKNSTEAEMVAMANALHVAKIRGYIKPGSTVMLQSDCQAVLSWIRYALPKTRDSQKDGVAINVPKRMRDNMRKMAALKFIVDLAHEMGLTFIVRHVKGHQQGEGRAWVNRNCDQLARKGMELRRSEIRKSHHAVD